MRTLTGRVAVITGAASGIGRAMAGRFAAERMPCVLADIEEGALEAAVGELRGTGAAAIGVPTDVSRPADVQALADRAISEFGAVHVLCNNAGVGGGTDFATSRSTCGNGSSAMEPSKVADTVADAIREQRFYVLPCADEAYDMAEQQLRWMRKGRRTSRRGDLGCRRRVLDERTT